MYARYHKTRANGKCSYKFLTQCHLFGCNVGLIPRLLARQIPPMQEEPYAWHLPIGDSLNGYRQNGVDFTDSALIIDLKPKRKKTNLSLYEVMDVWGYSSSGWTPILLHLSGLFVDADPSTVNRNEFVLNHDDRDEPVYEFMYLEGSVAAGKLDGRWTAPPASPTNAALLWPESLAYFVSGILARTPSVLELR